MHNSTQNPKTRNNSNFSSQFWVHFFEFEHKTRLDSNFFELFQTFFSLKLEYGPVSHFEFWVCPGLNRLKLKKARKKLLRAQKLNRYMIISSKNRFKPGHTRLNSNFRVYYSYSLWWDLNCRPLGCESSAVTTIARFHQLDASRKLQKARPFLLTF